MPDRDSAGQPPAGGRLAHLGRAARRPLRFATVGVLNTAIDMSLFALLHLGAGVGLLAANTLSYSAGVTNSFFCNKYWTFRETQRHGRLSRQLPLFVGLNLIGLGLSNATIWALAPLMPAMAAKLAAVGATFVWNYWSSRRFVYTPDLRNFSARSSAS
ncbi:MAG: GtrA family protein [Alphaproteobacteria bacterium]|jgi:putative flippase GtrA|nr:GtrA family protein [Alphaproteobacteria bacterium]